VNVDAVVSDKKKTTMLDLAGSPSFNYEAAAVSLNTANATRTSNAFRKTKNLGEMGYPKSMDGMTGQSKLDTYVTTSPQQAIYYAMDQPLDIADALKSNNPLQILKIEIPVKELKRLEGIEAGMGLTGKAFKSNDYFLKKVHNLGTGRTTPRSLSSNEMLDGYIQGFVEVKPQLGYRYTTPGNDVSIFSLGIDPGYVTVLKGDNYNDLIKKFPEMKGHVLENISLRKSLEKRKMSTNYNDYNYYEFTD
jgi:hypothetical protein